LSNVRTARCLSRFIFGRFKSTAKAIEERDKVGCLAKPFNPFELKEKSGDFWREEMFCVQSRLLQLTVGKDSLIM
jgi:hypothetical protein